MLLLSDINYFAVGEESGVSILDLHESKVIYPTLGTKNVTSLVHLPVLSDSGKPVFASCTDEGVLKVWREGENKAYWIEIIKTMKAHSSQISDLVSYPNGALLTCGHDKSICLWEEKKGGVGCGGNSGCCNIF